MSNIFVDRIATHGEDFTSSNVDILGYDVESSTLYVEFHSGTNVYSYSGVSESTYEMLVGASSVGGFYFEYIRGTYTSENVGTGVIELRDDSESTETETKWDSVPEGETPDFAQATNLAPSRFSVKWTDDSLRAGPFEPEFEALSEADALVQFKARIADVFGTSISPKVLAVTHHFE